MGGLNCASRALWDLKGPEFIITNESVMTIFDNVSVKISYLKTFYRKYRRLFSFLFHSSIFCQKGQFRTRFQFWFFPNFCQNNPLEIKPLYFKINCENNIFQSLFFRNFLRDFSLLKFDGLDRSRFAHSGSSSRSRGAEFFDHSSVALFAPTQQAKG